MENSFAFSGWQSDEYLYKDSHMELISRTKLTLAAAAFPQKLDPVLPHLSALRYV